MRRLAAIVALTLVWAGCSEERDYAADARRANEILSTQGGDAWRRAEALFLYRQSEGKTGDPELEHDIDFGIGMITLLDAVQGVLLFVDQASQTEAEPNLGGDDPAELQEETVPLPPPERLAELVDDLLHGLLDDGVVAHWAELVPLEDYEFTFVEGGLQFPPFPSATSQAEPGEEPVSIDLSGTWDLTEIRIIYGVLQAALAGLEYVYAYDGVVETVLSAALTEATLPALPSSPVDFPLWLNRVVETLGLEPAPWLDPEFGVLSGGTDALVPVRARLQDGLDAIAAGFAYLDQETDDDDDVFPRSAFVSTIITRLAGDALGDAVSLISAVDGLLPVFELRGFTAALAASLRDETPFVPSQFFWNFLATGIGLLLPDYDGPLDPLGLRIPGFQLAALFTDPILRLTEATTGLFPYSCMLTDVEANLYGCKQVGVWAAVSEQEPFTDSNGDGVATGSEFDSVTQDTGVDGQVDANRDGVADAPAATTRPGAGDGIWQEPIALRADEGGEALLPPLMHASPLATGGVDAPNGIVDPIYLFFPNPSFNGFFVPLTGEVDNNEYAADVSATYGNGDLNRLIAAITWIVQSIDEEENAE